VNRPGNLGESGSADAEKDADHGLLMRLGHRMAGGSGLARSWWLHPYSRWIERFDTQMYRLDDGHIVVSNA